MKRKMIIIDSISDYNKFLKRIHIYKSFLYCNTYFEIKNNINDEMLEYVAHALNIKNRKKRIEYIYDKSCEYIDKNNNQTNMCGFKNNQCYVQRKLNNGKCNGCCRKCLYQSKNGCLTKNLTCKLFNCSEVTSRYDVVKYNDLKILRLLSFKNRVIMDSEYFSKREDILRDLYKYSFTYSSIRIIYRIIRNLIILHKKNKKM